MFEKTRPALAAPTVCLLVGSLAFGQQQVTGQQPLQQPAAQQPLAAQQLAPQQQPAAAPPAAAQSPAGFQLNAIEQAYLDQVLDAWQQQSGQIQRFKCAFQRWEYDVAFGPGPNIPLNKNDGELSFQRPDKGSFQIKTINTWQAQPAAPGATPDAAPQGGWVPQESAVGEHWVCDGKSVFEYQHDKKQLVERPIPPQLQGQAIVDGPLPFLFGAEATKLKAKYWLRIQQQPNQNELWLTAIPKGQAADFKAVDVILDKSRMLPTHMQVHLPNGSRHLYFFDVANAAVNGKLAALLGVFDRPRKPTGWTHIVEAMPVAQVPAAPKKEEQKR